MSEETKTVQLRARRVFPGGTPPPPQVAHKFGFHRVGTTLVFEVGYFDMATLREQVEGVRTGQITGTIESDLYVSHVFGLSPEAVADLIEVVDQLKTGLAKERVE